jgi:hypothetical protein
MGSDYVHEFWRVLPRSPKYVYENREKKERNWCCD